MIKYGRLSGQAILMLGKTVGKNCMRSKYNRSGISTMDIYNPNNYATLQNMQSQATLGIYEYLASNNLISGATPEDLRQARKAGYKACNLEMRALQAQERKHIFIDMFSTNEDGEPSLEIVDVTATIESRNNEILMSIEPYCTETDIKIIKMVSKGYTMETIAKKIGVSKRHAFRLLADARERAQQSLK